MVKLTARVVYILALNRDINLVSDLEVYRTIVFICLLPLTLLSLLDSITGDFLGAIYSFNKLNYLVKMPRWLVRLLSQEAGKWSGTSINSGICTIEQ